MIHLAAFANGKKWRLKDGKTVEVDFLFETKKEDISFCKTDRYLSFRSNLDLGMIVLAE
ncbi:MAG: hypothetical protein ACI97N_000251 [Cognaticolwellia sp.]|jgi:hypothetical protein